MRQGAGRQLMKLKKKSKELEPARPGAADEFTRLRDVFTVWHMGVKRSATAIMLPWAEYSQPAEKQKWPLLPEVLRVSQLTFPVDNSLLPASQTASRQLHSLSNWNKCLYLAGEVLTSSIIRGKRWVWCILVIKPLSSYGIPNKPRNVL